MGEQKNMEQNEMSHLALAPSALNSYSNVVPIKEEPKSSPLLERSVPHPYKKKQILFYEGNPAVGIYRLHVGRVKVYKTGPNGQPYILCIANPGDFIGVESLLAGEDYMASAEMLEEGTATFIERGKFLSFIKEDTDFLFKIADSLAKRLKASDEERVNIAEGCVRERMARALVLLARSYGVSLQQGVLINLKLSREDLASIVGTAAGTVMRLLKEFKEEDSILLQGKQIIIRNMKQLEKTANLC